MPQWRKFLSKHYAKLDYIFRDAVYNISIDNLAVHQVNTDTIEKLWVFVEYIIFKYFLDNWMAIYWSWHFNVPQKKQIWGELLTNYMENTSHRYTVSISRSITVQCACYLVEEPLSFTMLKSRIQDRPCFVTVAR